MPRTGPKRCAPDIGHGPDWQGKRAPLTPPAGQETAPAAGLGRWRGDLLRKFIASFLVVDPGIVWRTDDRNYGRNARRRRPGNVLAGAEQRGCRHRRRFWLLRRRGRGCPGPRVVGRKRAG